MREVRVKRFVAAFREAPKELILDFDATDDCVHGPQEGRFFDEHYGDYCFCRCVFFATTSFW
jgi:hypothetical protein